MCGLGISDELVTDWSLKPYRDPEQGSPPLAGLGPNVFVPVCAPHLAASIRSPDDLKSHLLLTNETNTVSWEDWFNSI